MPGFAGTLYPFRLYSLIHIPWEGAPHLETLTIYYQGPRCGGQAEEVWLEEYITGDGV